MTRQCTDHLGREITFGFPPARIVSLCPSLTETLFAFGLGDCLVGRTTYCVHPADKVQAVPVVGGTKDVKPEAVAKLRPDLIIASREENTADDVNRLARSHPVYVVDVESYDDALRAIADLGEITGRTEQASRLVADIRQAFAALLSGEPQTVLYLIWKEPYMAAGPGTYIHSLLVMSGLRNACAPGVSRYPKLTPEELQALSPEVVILPSEPFRYDESDREELQTLLPNARIILVDGELLSWYGVRMLQAPRYLAGLLRRIQRKPQD